MSKTEKLRVVLVDDSPGALAKLESLLRSLGCVEVVGTATDGAMAVTVVGQKRPDLVLMDIVMPRLDGIAALRLLRIQQPELRVAIVSSVGGAASRASEAFRLGAVQVVAKPFEPEQIESLLRRELERKRSAAGPVS
jgi:two-component system response regulator (stage 0 sporulation protein A)